MPDWEGSLTMDLKRAGNLLCLIGDFQPAFGGSHFNLANPQAVVQEGVPRCSTINPEVYRAFYTAVTRRLVASCHDLSEGGLAVTAAEMIIAGRLGAKLELEEEPDPLRTLFGETSGCLLVEIAPADRETFRAVMGSLPCRWIGTVESSPALQVDRQGKNILDVNLNRLLRAWKDGVVEGPAA
jgi:phosphoribosylformylglycinamidine synthase